jgi:hypothetical protein
MEGGGSLMHSQGTGNSLRNRAVVTQRATQRGELQRILYGGRWWLPPSLGCGESSESKVGRGLSQH